MCLLPRSKSSDSPSSWTTSLSISSYILDNAHPTFLVRRFKKLECTYCIHAEESQAKPSAVIDRLKTEENKIPDHVNAMILSSSSRESRWKFFKRFNLMSSAYILCRHESDIGRSLTPVDISSLRSR